MPANLVEPTKAVPRPVFQRSSAVVGPSGGWVQLNPRYRDQLAAAQLVTASALIDLPGEVVSGHPDRHVVRVTLPGWEKVFYLKRQHRVGWRERLRHYFAGLGWVSRCEHEARVLRELTAAGFRCPEWVAYGEDGNGRAFLLVEELAGSELRKVLGSGRFSPADRGWLSEQLGRYLAELHGAGFKTPDATAKHLFIDPVSFSGTLIDWQAARRTSVLRPATVVRMLAALDASLAAHLADRRDRLRFLWAYRRVTRTLGCATPRFSQLVRAIDQQAVRARTRRSIRDQNQPGCATTEQRLMWLAGEAVCAVPNVAAVWPEPAISPPFYGAPNSPVVYPIRTRLADGRPAALVRGRSVAPVGRLVAWVRGRSWRSPGVTTGRVLFHLQRYGIPAPVLLAFGQRTTSRMKADWFALFEPPAGRPLAEWLAGPAPPSVRREVFDQVGRLLRQLHDAGCRYTGSVVPFRVSDEAGGRVSVGDPHRIRIVRRIGLRARRRDLHAVIRKLPDLSRTDRMRVLRGYYGVRWSDDPAKRSTAEVAVIGTG